MFRRYWQSWVATISDDRLRRSSPRIRSLTHRWIDVAARLTVRRCVRVSVLYEYSMQESMSTLVRYEYSLRSTTRGTVATTQDE